jgi:hypothetical protein
MFPEKYLLHPECKKDRLIFAPMSSEKHSRIFAVVSCRVHPGKPSGFLVAGREEQFVHLPIFAVISSPDPGRIRKGSYAGIGIFPYPVLVDFPISA